MDTFMNQQEVQRTQVLELLHAQQITQPQAAQYQHSPSDISQGLVGLISQQRCIIPITNSDQRIIRAISLYR